MIHVEVYDMRTGVALREIDRVVDKVITENEAVILLGTESGLVYRIVVTKTVVPPELLPRS